MLPAPLVDAARKVVTEFEVRALMLATAESCTGGLVSGAVTTIAGSSAVLERGFVTYSNEAKADMLDVPASLIATHGAVSEEVARAMASGALARSRASIAVAITGIAGPGGGTPAKPVGLVHLAGVRQDGLVLHRRELFAGDRDAIRLQAALTALTLALETART